MSVETALALKPEYCDREVSAKPAIDPFKQRPPGKPCQDYTISSTAADDDYREDGGGGGGDDEDT